jgi:hypothetical protein
MLKRTPFHPFLFAIFPVLALLGHNITEVSLNVIVRPLFVILAGTVVLFVLSRLLLRDTLKAGLVVTFFLLLFFTYGQVYNFLKENPLQVIDLARHRYLIVLYGGLFILGLIAIQKVHIENQNANLTLNLLSLFLLIYPVYQIVRYSITTPSEQTLAAKWTPQMKLTANSSQGNQPDVYYIILDGYSRADMIKKKLGYDNTPFLDQLRGLGFVIGSCSRSNYNATHTSITSSLNMEMLPTIFQWAEEQGISSENVWSFLKQSQVRKQFEKLGYKIVGFDTGFEWTRLKDADLYLSLQTTPLGMQWITPFESMLIDTTLVSIYTDWQAQAYHNKFTEVAHPQSYFINQEKFKLTELPKIAKIDAPTFTFAHILIPHIPFVFSPNGILTDPGFFSGKLAAPSSTKYFNEGYIDEIQYDNQQFIPILTYILKNSSTPPIIVIQGDHGFGTGANRFPILNAYYLPGKGSQKIYPSVSPVNTFRIIFDTYFGGSYGLLPDQSFAGEGSGQPIPESEPACK